MKNPATLIDVSNTKLNWLRAAVLGANDGIVSTAALVVGVAGAANASPVILEIGIAGLLAGAFSMALGEYVSVSSQLDVEEFILERERTSHLENPEAELDELASIYEGKGLSKKTARAVAVELSAKDAFKAHLDAELGIDPNDLSNPFEAAVASAISFSIGGLIPFLAIILPSHNLRIPITFIAVFVALVLTGLITTKISGVGKVRPTIRIVLGGMIAMCVTLGIGMLFGGHAV